MKNIIISNPEDFEAKKKKFISGGIGRVHVVADFDRTLTKAFLNGEKTPSIISELRTRGYISEEYSKKANELSSKYHPIEINPDISLEEKKKAMHEWWSKHFELLINSGLSKEHIKKIIDSGRIKFREGGREFLDLLNKEKIPLIILSSAGLGEESIVMFLEKEKRLYPNIITISNGFIWKGEKAVGVKEPIIHVFNKEEASLKHYKTFDTIEERKNVILLGDSLGDVDMIKGFKCDNLIKIGFLNEEIEKNLKHYKKTFDVIILNDSDMGFVDELLKELLK